MRSMEVKLSVQNMVTTVRLHTRIPLERVSLQLENAIYNPEEFPGLVLRLSPKAEPSKTALVFSSGKAVITGAKDEEEVKRLVDELISCLRKAGVDFPKEPEYQIQNIVLSGDLKMKINLNKVAMELEGAEYDPDQFPGVIYKPYSKEKSITFLIFSSGRVVCTGAKSLKEAKEETTNLIKRIREIQKG